MVTFATVLFGNEQIKYLYVLLQSIAETYCEEACVIVYYAGVDEKYIEEIRRKAPSVLLRECLELDYSDEDWKVKASFKTQGWYKIISEQRWPEHLAFVDVDTLIVNPIDHYFDTNADVIFTYKTNEDENLKWPINSGVILANNDDEQALEFLKEWSDDTFLVINAEENIRLKQRHSWGGEDQAAMGYFIGNDTKKYSGTIVTHNILFQGVPCEELNECRCVPITNKTHIIHYKGKWRPVLAGKGWDPKWRPQEKCQEMFNLWHDTLESWEQR